MPADAKTKPAKAVLFIVLAVVAGAAAWLFWSGRSSAIDLDPYSVVGAVTAEETAKLLGDRGQVLVMFRDTGPNSNPVLEAQLQGIRQTCKKRAGLKVVTEGIRVDAMMMMSTGGGVPAKLFLQALQSHANTSAVILFFGFPELTETERDALKKANLKMVVLSSFRPGYKQLFEQGALHLAVVPRPDTPQNAQPPRNARERFAQEYMLITPAEAARWP
jgi:hypothetical protein